MKFLGFLLPVFAAVVIGSLFGVEKIFDGETFAGWDGDIEKTWRIEGGAFVGGSLEENVPHNEFIATTASYTNFVLRLEFKLEGSEGFINAGVQIRSQRIPEDPEMIGYQLDMGDPAWWGSLYDESRRNRVLAQADSEAVNAVLRRGDWNQYEIRAEGPRITAHINGLQTIDYVEEDASIPLHGRIGMQIHGGGKALARYRNIVLQKLP